MYVLPGQVTIGNNGAGSALVTITRITIIKIDVAMATSDATNYNKIDIGTIRRFQ